MRLRRAGRIGPIKAFNSLIGPTSGKDFIILFDCETVALVFPVRFRCAVCRLCRKGADLERDLGAHLGIGRDKIQEQVEQAFLLTPAVSYFDCLYNSL